MAEVKSKAETPTKPQAVELPKVTPLMPTRMQSGEFKRNLWVVTAFENTTPESMVSPEYWAHVAAELRPYDRIEARADDGSWFAEFLVLDASRNWARVKLLSQHDLTSGDVSLSQAILDQYEVKHRGPERQWSVIRKSDNELLKDAMGTRAAAYGWLAEHLKG